MVHTGIKIFEGLPCYQSNTAVIGEICNCGPGLAEDIQPFSKEDSYLYVISGSDENEFDRYIESFDIPYICSNKTEAGKFYTYRINGYIYHIYYTFSNGRVTVIEDRSSSHIPEEVNVEGETEELSIYQYSLNYEDSSVEYLEPGFIDCGMMYIIKFSDNSLVLVDSGHGKQATPMSQEGLYNFLKKISNTRDGEKIKIRAWIFTHAHGDHCGLAATFLGEDYIRAQKESSEKNYADKLELENVIYNFPSRYVAVGTYAVPETMAMKAAMRKNFPNVGYIKAHTGQRLTISGVHFDVLYTWEDSLNSDGSWGLKEFNSTSIIIKLTYKNHSFMLLADMAKAAEEIVLRNYTEKTLSSEIVQIAHHCINKLDIYSTVNAGYALVPSSYRLMSVRNPVQYAQFKDVCNKGIYCGDVYTWEIALTKQDLNVRQHMRYDAGIKKDIVTEKQEAI